MKNKLLLLLLVCSQVATVFAQDPQIPDFKNSPMLLKKDGSISKLEKTTTEIKQKQKGFSYGASTTSFINILGGHSPVKVDPADATFIVKLADAEIDPEGALYLTKVVVSRDTRELELSQSATAMASVFGGKGKSVKRDDIKCEFTKVSPGVYKFVPSTPLTPGTEWAIVFYGSNLTFCFATTGDSKGKK